MAADLEAEVHKLMGEEKWREAVNLLTAQRHPIADSYDLLWNWGWCYFKLNEPDTAVIHLRAAVDIEPRNAGGRWALATALAEAGDTEAPEREFLASLQIQDGHLPRTGLALLLLRQGRADEAERVHLEGLRLRPDSRERQESCADFLWDTGRHQESRKAYARAEAYFWESRTRAE